MVDMCKRIISPGVFFFFHFFKISFFGVLSGVKGQKLVLNDKKLSVALHISGSMCKMVHMCKIMTSLGAFFIFSKF